jgi:hypothetical protein
MRTDLGALCRVFAGSFADGRSTFGVFAICRGERGSRTAESPESTWHAVD